MEIETAYYIVSGCWKSIAPQVRRRGHTPTNHIPLLAATRFQGTFPRNGKPNTSRRITGQTRRQQQRARHGNHGSRPNSGIGKKEKKFGILTMTQNMLMAESQDPAKNSHLRWNQQNLDSPKSTNERWETRGRKKEKGKSAPRKEKLHKRNRPTAGLKKRTRLKFQEFVEQEPKHEIAGGFRLPARLQREGMEMHGAID